VFVLLYRGTQYNGVQSYTLRTINCSSRGRCKSCQRFWYFRGRWLRYWTSIFRRLS